MNTEEDPITHEDIMGKTVLVGITRVTHQDEFIEQIQYSGTVTKIGQSIRISKNDGIEQKLPPDLSSFRRAKPGTYKLRSTGEEIENPDFTTTWTIVAPDPEISENE